MPDAEAVAEEAVVQEVVGEEHGGEDNKEVEELTEDEAIVVDVVFVVDVGTEELNQFINVLK